MKLIIAEKPDAARQMAAFLEPTQKNNGYLTGTNYLFTWGYGHLVELAGAESYTGKKSWDLSDLPILPVEFQLNPAADKIGQIKVIQSLVARNDVTGVINACDPDREGELIFRYIWKYIGGNKPVERVWLNTFTKADVQKAFSNPDPSKKYNNLAFAGKARSEADWLLGINATRALSLSVNRGTLSLGRVQTATLALICKRTLENQNFKPSPFWKILLKCTFNGSGFILSTERYTEKDKVEKDAQTASKYEKIVTDVKKKEETENPPLLYDLTALQQDANRFYGMTAADTDKTAQQLYQAGIMSYPRTDSQYIGNNLFAEIPALIASIGLLPPFVQMIAGYPAVLNNRPVDDTKVTGHHALLPTKELTIDKWNGLDQTDKKVLTLVINRMLQAFAEACKKNVVIIEANAGGVAFSAKGTTIIKPGWRGILNIENDNEDDPDQENNQKLPELKINEKLAGETSISEGKTKAPELFTERTLIAAMKNCSAEIEDKSLKTILKEVEGIGRPATRSGIIETLFLRKYCLRQKNKIIPTELGMAVYDLVKNFRIANPLLTAEWEQKLDEISSGKMPYLDFTKECKEYTSEITREILSLKDQTQKINHVSSTQEVADMLVCPKCKKQTVKSFTYKSKKEGEGECNAIGCRDKECGFVYWNPEICGKKLTKSQLATLVKNGKTGEIKGFKSKAGKDFDGKLRFKSDFSVEFFN